ncbi:MAG: Type secretion system protein precursor [Pseudomonadota bacterium]|jgi:type IV fimbrial biogenesis protein FimT
MTRSDQWPSHGERGFTLLEALVVLAVVAILVSLAAPSLSSFRQQNQLQSVAESLFNSMSLARSEALRRQQTVTMCPRASDAECDTSDNWQQGWLTFVDANGNAQREPDEIILEIKPALWTAVRLNVSNTAKAYFSYGAQGRSQTVNGGFMAGTWRFCLLASPTGWQVVVNALGRPRVEKYAPQSC